MVTPQQNYMTGYNKKPPGIARRVGQVAAGAGVIGAGALGIRHRKTLGWAAKNLKKRGLKNTVQRASMRINRVAKRDIHGIKTRLGMAKANTPKPPKQLELFFDRTDYASFSAHPPRRWVKR